MSISVSEHDQITVIALSGKIMGGPEAGEINDKINSLIDQGKKKIVVDLEKVEWMNSSGLGILIGAIQILKDNNGSLALIHVSERIRNLLKITKLLSVFPVYKNVDEAKASM